MIEPISSLRKEGSRFATFLRYISNSLAERVLRNEFGDYIKVICHARTIYRDQTCGLLIKNSPYIDG